MVKVNKFCIIALILLASCRSDPNTNTLSQVYSKSSKTIKSNAIQNADLTTINIIDINSLNLNREYLTHYYYGINLAIEEFNKKGGIKGINLELITKNDYNSYIQGYMAAEEAGKTNNPTVFLGSTNFASSLGVAEYAKNNNIPYLITGLSSENILLENPDINNPIIFRVRDGYLVHIKAIVNSIAQLPNSNSVAIFTYANSEGDYLFNTISTMLKKVKPNVHILNNIRTPKAIQSETNFIDLRDTPAGVVIIAIDGTDIESLALKLQRYKLLINKKVYIMFAGEPEWLDSLGNYTPHGWIATGFPWYSINNIDNTAFFKTYFAKYKLRPRYGSYIGYVTINLLVDALKKAGYGETCVVNSSECRLMLAKELESAQFKAPFLDVEMDKSKSNLGTYLGILQPFNTTTQNKRGGRIEKLDIRMFNSVFVSSR